MLNIRSFIARDSLPGWSPNDHEIYVAYVSVVNKIQKMNLDSKIYNYQFLSYIYKSKKIIHVVAVNHLHGIEAAPSSCDDCENAMMVFLCVVDDNDSIYPVFEGANLGSVK
jgi:hypothetical protein